MTDLYLLTVRTFETHVVGTWTCFQKPQLRRCRSLRGLAHLSKIPKNLQIFVCF